jgi:hypothetical protein
MSNIGNTEALESYLKLEQENKRLRQEIEEWKYRYKEYYNAWQKISAASDTLWHWLETRENTKTQTIKRKMAETFQWAYMQAEIPELRAKWKNAEAREWAEKRYPPTADSLTSSNSPITTTS